MFKIFLYTTKIITPLFFIIFFFSRLDAQTNIDSLKNVIPRLSGSKKADAMHNLSKSFIYSDPQKATEYAAKALETARSAGYKEGEAQINLTLGRTYVMQGKYEESLKCFNDALQISSKNGMTLAEANALNSLGNYYYMIGNMPEALNYYEKALIKGEQIDYKNGVLNYLNNIGIIYGSLGDYEKSIEYYLRSLKISEYLGDKRGMMITYVNIGTIYYEMDRYAPALENYKKSLAISHEIKDRSSEADCLINISQIYSEQGKYDESLQSNLKALSLKKAVGDKYGIANSLNNIGSDYKSKGDFQKALAYHKNALEINEEIGNKEGIIASLFNIGLANYKSANYLTAIKNYEKALQLSRNTNTKLTHDILMALSKAYPETGNYKRAFNYLQEGVILKDSIFNEDIMQRVHEIGTKYDFEKQKAKIQLLQRDTKIQELELERSRIIRNSLIAGFALLFIIALFLINRNRLKNRVNKTLEDQNKKINEQAERLKILNTNKDKFFSILAHDLRNPMNALLGLSESLSHDIDSMTENEIKEFSAHIYTTSAGLFSLLDNLLVWSKFQSDSIKFYPETINLKAEVQNVENLYAGSLKKKNITLEQDLEESLSIKADRYMLNSILQNIISNAIKFSYKNSVINITAEKRNGDVHIEIKDKGTGIEEIKIKNLFSIKNSQSTRGTDNEKGSGLGLILAKEMIEKHNGKFDIISMPEKGTIVKLILPSN